MPLIEAHEAYPQIEPNQYWNKTEKTIIIGYPHPIKGLWLKTQDVDQKSQFIHFINLLPNHLLKCLISIGSSFIGLELKSKFLVFFTHNYKHHLVPYDLKLY